MSGNIGNIGNNPYFSRLPGFCNREHTGNKTGNITGNTDQATPDGIRCTEVSRTEHTKQVAQERNAKQSAQGRDTKQAARDAENSRTHVEAPESRSERFDGHDGQVDHNPHRRAEKGGFSRQSGMYYAEYVDHMLRHYSRTRNADEDELHGHVDAQNWAACRDALNRWKETDRTVIIRVFCTVKSRTDDAVRAVAEEMRMPYGQVFALVRRARKEIARERGLIE